MKVHDDDGAELNAAFSVLSENGDVLLFLESMGPSSKAKPTRNAEYAPGFELLAIRLGKVGAILKTVEVDSRETQALTPEQRKIWAPDFPFPLELSLLKDVKDFRLQVGRSCAAVGRPPGEKTGGGRYKRLKLTLTWPSATAISTMKLVDTLEEQNILEKLLDETKPPIPENCAHLHYLLFTPFRYAKQNSHASRFRPGGSAEGVFYAAASPETAISEMTFYRLLFFAESPGTPLPTNVEEFTAFAIQIRTSQGVDLTRPPLNAHSAEWTHAEDYTQCHRLVAVARQDDFEAISYSSVRDPQHRLNYAVLSPSAFSQSKPIAYQTWRIHFREDGVLAKCEMPEMGISFAVADFASDSRIKRAA